MKKQEKGYLQKNLSFPSMNYGHIPIATLNQKKLSIGSVIEIIKMWG